MIRQAVISEEATTPQQSAIAYFRPADFDLRRLLDVSRASRAPPGNVAVFICRRQGVALEEWAKAGLLLRKVAHGEKRDRPHWVEPSP